MDIQAGITIVRTLTTEIAGYISQASGASSERKRLRDELRSCEFILTQLQDESGDSEEGDNWVGTLKALSGHDAPLGRLQIALTALRESLAPRKGPSGLLIKLRWPFDQDGVDKIISSLDREKNLLNLALANDTRRLVTTLQQKAKENADSLATLINTVDKLSINYDIQFEVVKQQLTNTDVSLLCVRDGVDLLRQSQTSSHENHRRENILEWLTSTDYSIQHRDIIHLHEPGTCQWLLESGNYQQWLALPGQTLFCPGGPGAGKTIASAAVVDSLLSSFETDSTTGFAYIYCNFRQQTQQSTDNLISSLLKQILQQNNVIPNAFSNLYEAHTKLKTRPNIKELLQLFPSVSSMYERTFIVIDAVDEFSNSERETKHFIKQMLELQQLIKVNLLFTSRPMTYITQLFQNVLYQEISATEEDVRLYVESNLQNHLPRCVLNKPELELETAITEGIVQAAQGMFLLSRLHLYSFSKMKTVRSVKTALQTLPQGLGAYDEIYRDTMRRIENQGSTSKALANKILMWLVHAKEPLKAISLQHAVAVEDGMTDIDEDDLPPIDDMISDCAGLVTVDEDSGIIRLIHYTTQEYLHRTRQEWFPAAEEEIVTTCIRYLMLSPFSTGTCYTDIDLEKRLAKYPFYKHASSFWGYYAIELQHLEELILCFIRSQAHMEACTQVLSGIYSFDVELDQIFGHWTGLHLMAFFGLCNLITAFLHGAVFDPSPRDHFGRTPLMFAIIKGHIDVVRLLVESYKADVHEADHFGDTPLCWATKVGNRDIVNYLLDYCGVNIDVKNFMDQSPTEIAIMKEHRDVLQLLIDRAANLSLGIEESLSNLYELRINTILYTHMGFPNLRKPQSFTRNSVSEEEAHLISDALFLTSVLWQHNPSNIQQGYSRISIQITNRPSAKVELIRLSGPGHCGSTPLHAAAEQGNTTIFTMILSRLEDKDIDTRNCFEETPLMFASRRGHSPIVQLLLSTGYVDANATDFAGNTAISLAMDNQHWPVVKMLQNYTKGLKDSSDTQLSCQPTLTSKVIQPNSKSDQISRSQGSTAYSILTFKT